MNGDGRRGSMMTDNVSMDVMISMKFSGFPRVWVRETNSRFLSLRFTPWRHLFMCMPSILRNVLEVATEVARFEGL